MSDKPLILYTLKTRDGITSEIRKCDHYMPKIETALRHAGLGMTLAETNVLDETTHEVRSRTYRMRKVRTVQFVEYEET